MPKARQAQRARGEEAVNSSLDAALRLVEHLPVPVFFKARDGRYLGVNRAWEEFFGIAREAFVGKRVADLYPQEPQVAARHAQMDAELYAQPEGGQSYEIPIRTAGRLRDTIYYKSTFTDGRGEVAGIIGAIVDITARKAAESALRDNEERWRTIVNSANDGILVYDRDLNVIAGNQAAERILGLPLAELIGAAGFTSRLATVHEDGKPISSENRPTRMTVRTGKPLTGHIVGIVRPGGARTWLSVNTALLRHPGASDWYGVVSTFSDITDWRNAQEALQESAIRFRETFELATSGIAHVGMDGRFQRVNRSLCAILGYEERELVGKSVKEISHPDDRDVTDAQRARVRSGELEMARFEKRYLRKDRGTVWVSLAIALARSSAGEPLYEVAVFDDITERKGTEAALRESEERFRRTFQLAGSGLAQVDLEGRFLRVNPQLCAFLGYGEAELVGMSVRELSHPEDRDLVDAPRVRLMAGETDSIRLEKRYLRKDGAVVWASVAIAIERDAAGRPQYAISVVDDITERKAAEAVLRESEERFRRTFELAGSGVAHIGLDRRFIRVNRRLTQILGYSEAELIGMTGREISHPDDLDAINSQRPRLYAGEIPHVRVEKRYLRKDGSIVWVAFSMVVERDAAGQPVYEIAIFDDITAQKQADAALREAHEELKRSNAELEQFAYVASHDLQEPLRMVSSYTQLIGKRYSDKLPGEAQEFMHYVVDGAARMKQLIEDLLAYSRVGTRGKEFKPVALEAPLRKAVTNLRAAIEESSAAVTWDPLPTLAVDEVQMAQLFQNLIGNALKFRGPSVPRVHVASSEKESEYEITVGDNGIGIEPAYFERIFMVFQRLHTMGEYPGTGIGLAICKKVVERHGGRIWVTSTPGEGSRFHFTLQKRGEDSHD